MRIIPVIGILGVGMVGFLDFATGYRISLSFFYLAPIVYGTWKGTWKSGALLALASGLVAMLADVLMDKDTAHEIFSYWNALNRLSVFFLTVFIVDRNRKLHFRLTTLVGEFESLARDLL